MYSMFLFLFFACTAYHIHTADVTIRIVSVGSVRAEKSDESQFVHKLWKEEKALLTYSDKPHVATLDTQDAKNEGVHIKGDARTVILPEEFAVNILYFERPWTFDQISFEEGNHDAVLTNTVALYIANLLRQVPGGTRVVVEWHPFVCSMNKYTGMEPQFVESPALLEYTKKNPFTGFFDNKLRLLATYLAIDKTPQPYDASFIRAADELVPLIKKRFEFYKSQNITHNQIIKKLNIETEIVNLVCDGEKDIKEVKITVHPSEEIDFFNLKVDHICLVKNDGTLVYKKLIDKKNPVKNPYSNYKTYLPNDILKGMLYSFLWSEITVILNTEKALQCFDDLGLINNTLTHGKSDLNNRSNVWLLSGFKAASA